MNEDQETQRRVEARLREAAPPVPQGTQSVWPAVQERLRPRTRSHVRPLLWAGVATACAALCVAWMSGHNTQTPPAAPDIPAVSIQVTKNVPTPIHKHLRHMPRTHKEAIAARSVRPRPSHIAYRKPVETPSPEQTAMPDKEADTPRLRPASAVPHPAFVKPVE